jgi:hypothetical protein
MGSTTTEAPAPARGAAAASRPAARAVLCDRCSRFHQAGVACACERERPLWATAALLVVLLVAGAALVVAALAAASISTIAALVFVTYTILALTLGVLWRSVMRRTD